MSEGCRLPKSRGKIPQIFSCLGIPRRSPKGARAAAVAVFCSFCAQKQKTRKRPVPKKDRVTKTRFDTRTRSPREVCLLDVGYQNPEARCPKSKKRFNIQPQETPRWTLSQKSKRSPMQRSSPVRIYLLRGAGRRRKKRPISFEILEKPPIGFVVSTFSRQWTYTGYSGIEYPESIPE